MKVGEAEFGVNKLEPVPRQPGDLLFKVLCPALHTAGWTKVSKHGDSHDLSPYLEGEMARQLKVTKPWWRELVACDHDRAAYLAVTGHGDCEAPPPVPKAQRVSKRRQKRINRKRR